MMQLSREERMLDVKSMTNVRDLGGYETQTGFYTKKVINLFVQPIQVKVIR